MKKQLSLILIMTIMLQAQPTQNEEMSFDEEFKEPTTLSSDNNNGVLKSYNVVMTTFNDNLYGYILSPIGKTYNMVMPNVVQTMIENFFENLNYPVYLANNLLQGKFNEAWVETQRFAINTTLGIGGLANSASIDFDLPHYKEDFGQTLGVWGFNSGYHIVLPLLGASNMRDIVGMGGDFFFNPLNYNSIPSLSNNEKVYMNVTNDINSLNGAMNTYFNITKDAIEIYPLLKTSYENYRIKQIQN